MDGCECTVDYRTKKLDSQPRFVTLLLQGFCNQKSTTLHSIMLHESKKFVITDSRSVLEGTSTGHRDTDEPIIHATLNIHYDIFRAGKNVILFWIPSHNGIGGNHLADKADKTAATLPVDNNLALRTHLVSNLCGKLKWTWNRTWTSLSAIQFYVVREGIFAAQPIHLQKKPDGPHEARIGHTRMTHGHLVTKRTQTGVPIVESFLATHHHRLSTSVAIESGHGSDQFWWVPKYAQPGSNKVY